VVGGGYRGLRLAACMHAASQVKVLEEELAEERKGKAK
jgi:hypothetical protein